MFLEHSDILKTVKHINWREYALVNPYRPGAGTPPEWLAGRDKLLNEAETFLSDLENGEMATIPDCDRERNAVIHKGFTVNGLE